MLDSSNPSPPVLVELPSVTTARIKQSKRVAGITSELLETWNQLPNDVKSDPDLSQLSRLFDSVEAAFEDDYGA